MHFYRTKFVIGLFVVLFLSFWVLLNIKNWSIGRQPHVLHAIGTFFGVAGYLFLSISLFLASRWPKLEDWLGGLDQIYKTHHRLGIYGCYLIAAHPLVFAFRWIPHHFYKFFLYFLPVHGRLAINLGSISLLLLLLLVALTSLKLLPYNRWKLTHKLMNVVFILATLHFLLLQRGVPNASQMMLFVPMGLGFFGILYKQVISDLIVKGPQFEITKTKALSDNLIEIFLKIKGKNLFFIPGQYVFCSFESNQITKESHPFTLCGAPGDSILSILVKARGDFTRSLYQNIKPGDLVRVEGPYGKFDYTKAGTSQIWIAGGIGIVPFLSWARLFDQRKIDIDQIDLFYCIHRKADAVFNDELHQISLSFPFFHFFIFCTEDGERLSVEKIQQMEGNLTQKQILMCGPRRLTQNFTSEFLACGVKKKNIFFEDFEFF